MNTLQDSTVDAPAAEVRRVVWVPMHVEVAHHVRELIVEGKMRQGERINENDLAEFLGVSRTPLRDALKILQGEGLIVIEPHRGTFVSLVTAKHTAKLFEALAGIERIGGETATLVATGAQIAALADLHRRMFAFHRDGERSNYFELNDQVHRAFVSLSGNEILVDIHAKLLVGARRIRFAAIRAQDRWDESVAEYKAILTAMQAREAERTGKLIEQHVHRTSEVVCASLKEFETELPPSRRRRSYQRRLGFAG